MRTIFSTLTALALLSGLGCHCFKCHQTCDCEKPIYGPCCPRDICSCSKKGCYDYQCTTPGPAVPAEEVQAPAE